MIQILSYGVRTAGRSLKASSALLGVVENMDGFSGASADLSADPHSLAEPGGFVSRSQGSQATLRFNTFTISFFLFPDRPVETFSLSKLVMVRVSREYTQPELCTPFQ